MNRPMSNNKPHRPHRGLCYQLWVVMLQTSASHGFDADVTGMTVSLPYTQRKYSGTPEWLQFKRYEYRQLYLL